MKRKLPPDAFQYYLGLGVGRSYQAVGDYYGASKRAVMKVARKEHWQDQLARAEAEMRKRVQERAVETITDVNVRHLKTLKAVEAKALKSLTTLPHNNAGDAARTLLAALAQERGIYEAPGGTGQLVLQIVTGVPRNPVPPDAPELLPPSGPE